MASISHKYLEKLRRDVGAFEQWLATTEAQDDGSASVGDLQAAFTKANSIYIKALALYRTTAEDEPGPEDEENDSAEHTVSRG